ncbi:phospho-N-acetylmuramoyl-pentapeptide-transferase [Fructilactobacillus sanfranciscensis]|uniref:phospho-N-acetylmuramoyl-pentapeptide- transferase n=1 Tax=Fructilactobacillus sanfranciscensis TaxID=1625 RepID=UPI000CD4311E|nr:phospho-N-acetylmuramoyl-pentapeptide-transferase [Fructilactobacillus sanfranciscensis]POH11637.1 phospho-N-acetylmuramoyl-pentapeptide-transferase [Fructilactobacillus sanfranciscensis]POH13034.1 phospho-N-acetylmuramoyl-pentapeptide-transferase [Fructilactobacillus sanfranciscensis]POH16153.1 phospho-N-acetylmuramoyl-pentapeptide-transferase [Fructilactobacillus sanfranciscensis]
MKWLLPILGGFILTLCITPFLISYFRAHKEGQVIWTQGLSWHKSKGGTPTMGGLGFITATLITGIAYGVMFHDLNANLMILLFVFLFFGLIGMWDDSIKVFNHQNDGFKAWQKFALQIFGSLIFALVYWANGFPMAINVFGSDLHLGFLYILFIIFWLTGFSNAVNLTDGLDGLASGLSAISFAAYAVVAYSQSQYEVMAFCLAIVGSLLAFLLFNHKPAKIFMGDMGSLALGAILAAVSIMLHHELSLVWIGLMFVVETLSVMIQVSYYRLTGKRIFKMTPIHHSFEMSGWSEWKIDIVFWLIGLFTSITGVYVML